MNDAAARPTVFYRATVEDAFWEVGEILCRQHGIGEITVFGSVGLLLQDYISNSTPDVDIRIDTNHGAVVLAIQEVADRRGWLRSWMNEAATQYLWTQTKRA